VIGSVAGAGAADVAPNTFTTVDVAPGIVAFVSPGTTSGVINGNSVAIVGDEAVLVIDSGQFPRATRRMIAQLRTRTDLPVRYLVNTHWHADHVLGNEEYRRAFPGIVVIAHDQTRRLMMENQERVLQLPAGAQGFLDSLRAARERGTRRDGTPLTADEVGRLRDQIQDLEAVAPELPEVRFSPADTTFSDTLTVRLGRREVRLLHLGAGNTAGDVMAWVPDQRVLVTGDVVVAPLPFGYGCHPAAWEDVLARVVALGPEAIVPGHGAVQRDLRYVRTLQRLLAALRAGVRAEVRAGRSLEETRARLDLAEIRRELTGGDPLREGAFDAFFLDSAVEQAYREEKGEPLSE
jgi:glyoxylase-like metal-dependent hydrolase (beta-lactamase superfamily II)